MMRSMPAALVVVLLAAAPLQVVAQPVPATSAQLRAALLDTGGSESLDLRLQQPTASERSIPLAFAMSAVVPGSGQAYNRQWLKAAGLIAAEVAIAAGYLVSHSQGVSARDDYHAYAHQHWQPTKYGHWLNDYKLYLSELNPSRPIAAPDVQVPTGIDFQNPNSWSEAERRAVQEFFNGMRQLEGQLYHAATGASFAHRIPYFGEQQYYELIGKYFHFSVGWEDYEAAIAEGRPTWMVEGEFLETIDPEVQDASGRYVNVSDRFWEYRDEHGRANDLFRRASRISTLFLANHLIAAVDAAVFAKLHNDRVKAEMTMEYDASGVPTPGARLSVRF